MGSLGRARCASDAILSENNRSIRAAEHMINALGRHILETLKNESPFGLVETTVRSGETPDVAEPDRYMTTMLQGEPRHFLVAVAPDRVRGRRPSGAVLLFRDVTQLREVDRRPREFLATVSDELKTPLTSIAMSVDVAEPLPRVRADVNKVTWVVTNLMSNALRYSSSGGRIEVSASLTGSHVEIWVESVPGEGSTFKFTLPVAA